MFFGQDLSSLPDRNQTDLMFPLLGGKSRLLAAVLIQCSFHPRKMFLCHALGCLWGFGFCFRRFHFQHRPGFAVRLFAVRTRDAAPDTHTTRTATLE